MKAVKFICPLCNKLFETTATFKQHMRKHWYSYIVENICPICSAPYSSLRVHVDEMKDPLHMLLYFSAHTSSRSKKAEAYKEALRIVTTIYKTARSVQIPFETCTHDYKLVYTHKINTQFIRYRYVCSICGSTLAYTEHT